MSEVRAQNGQTLGKRDAQEIMRTNEGFPPAFPFGRFFGLSPFALMRDFSNELDRAFQGYGSGPEASGWAPFIDVQLCDGTLQVSAELAGLKRDDVKVKVTDNALIIEGERKQEHKGDQHGFHRWERSYGQFYRSLPLPEGARTDQVKAQLKDGVLKVSVPVPEARKKLRQIPIEEVTKASPAAM